jgi:hypothetical protein
MSTSTPRRPARAVAILLLLVGLGGYVVAAAADHSVGKVSAVEDRALGTQDPVAAASALRRRTTPITTTYNTYASASLVVGSTRGELTRLFNLVRPTSTAGPAEAADARGRLSESIAAYGVAIERQKVAQQAYAHELALLMAEVHR